MRTTVYRITLLGPDGSKSFLSWIRSIKNGHRNVITTRDETSNTIMLFNTKEEADRTVQIISGIVGLDVKVWADACDKSIIRRQF
jgi:hypothetical protein